MLSPACNASIDVEVVKNKVDMYQERGQIVLAGVGGSQKAKGLRACFP
jgi:hypothetical protein